MAEETSWTTKPEVRVQAQVRLKALTEAAIKAAQQDLKVHLSEFLRSQKGVWGAYRPMVGEASPSDSIQTNQHLQWAYPLVKNNVLEFYLEPKAWRKGQFGIEEPDAQMCNLIDVTNLNGYLVPGLAFDRVGTRLGRGKGYFDQALMNFKGIKVGLAYDVQIFDKPLPKESFDVPMDLIITNRGVVYFNKVGDRRND